MIEKASEIQVGGNHYKNMPYQPIEFYTRNNIPFCEANVIKYIVRYKHKNGVEDLRKALHYCILAIEFREDQRCVVDPLDWITFGRENSLSKDQTECLRHLREWLSSGDRLFMIEAKSIIDVMRTDFLNEQAQTK